VSVGGADFSSGIGACDGMGFSASERASERLEPGKKEQTAEEGISFGIDGGQQ